MAKRSSKDEFAKTYPKLKDRARNYSHWGLISKLDQYASMVKTGEQQKEIKRIKEEYLEQVKRNETKRIARNVHFHSGLRVGLHQLDNHHNIALQREAEDQHLRAQTYNKAKSYYNNFSLSKSYLDTLDKQRRSIRLTFLKAGKRPRPSIRKKGKEKLRGRVDLYIALAKSKKHKAVMQRLRQDYIDRRTDMHMYRTFIAHSILRAPDARKTALQRFNHLKRIYKEQDRQYEQTHLKKVKAYYHKNYSLTKLYNGPNHSKYRDKEIPKDKG